MHKITCSINEFGTREWRHINDYEHRSCNHNNNGPAVIYPNGNKHWFVNGKWHRLDGPAVEHPTGHKEWWVTDRRHRLDGPAIEYSNGVKALYVNNVCYKNELEYWIAVQKYVDTHHAL